MILASACVLIVAMLCLTLLRVWRSWLDLRRLEMAQRSEVRDDAGVRIELAAVKERIRKLEAIASGVEL
jgi:hypothetical protein